MKREKTKKDENFSILSKLKPRKIAIDKERLYEENMALKLRNNTLNEDNLRLKTKISQIEKELNKKEEQAEFSYLKPTHLLANLKNSIKDLRQEIGQKNEEIVRLKRNIKNTKIGEVEVEVQAYIDECTRLRHHLEEIMRQKDTPQAAQNFNVDEQNMQQSILLNNLRKENDNLNQALLLGKDEINKWRERVQELEKERKKNAIKKGEISGYKSEIKQLKSQIELTSKEFASKEIALKEELTKQKKAVIEFSNKSISYESKIKELQFTIEDQKNTIKSLQEQKPSQNLKKKQYPPKLFRILFNATSLRRVSVKNVMQSIDRKGKGQLTVDEFYESLLELSSKVKKKHVFEVSGFLKIKKNFVDMNRVAEFFEEFVYDGNTNISSSDEETVFKNFVQVAEVNFDSPISQGKKRNVSGTKNERLSNAEENITVKKNLDIEKAKIEEGKRKIEESKKIEEAKIAEEKEEKKRQAEKQRIEEQRKMEEKKKNDEKKKQEEQKKLEEQRKIEEQKKLEEKKRPEDKAKNTKQLSEDKGKNTKQLSDDKSKMQENSNKSEGLNLPQSSEQRRPQSSRPLSTQSKDLLAHLSFRMQLNRIPKNKLYITLFPSFPPERQLASQDLLRAFKASPFSFADSECESLAKSLLDYNTVSAKMIEEKILKNTENWEIFTPEDENSFDEELGNVISKNKDPLKEKCKFYDKEKEGLISLNDFEKVLKELKIEFAARLFKYMLLLFYSHDMKIGQVPYRHFIKAYGEAAQEEEEFENSDDLSDEEKAKIVRHYLALIAKILIKNKRTASDVFEYDENGIISAEEFIHGLKRIGLSDIEHDHVMIMLEALQIEDAEEVCISIDELEEILDHYGVQKNSLFQGEEPENVESAMGHYKKISLLDSDQYENSEEEEEDNEEDSNYGDDFQ